MRGVMLPLLAAAVVACGLVAAGEQRLSRSIALPVVTQSPAPSWTLAWSDEFEQPDGSLPDPKKWTYDIGGNGWGNHELEYYTNRPANAAVHAGKLAITALREDYTGADQAVRKYTSARLKTQGIFTQAYGKFEARIQIPRGQGIWPAFWMLGDDIEGHGWPLCGEIDVMENIGKEPSTVHGSLHGPGYSGDQDFTSIFHMPGGTKFADDFHLYSAEWEPGVVRFSVDAQQYAEFKTSQLPTGKKWIFDHPFFILLNVAVGGDWPGPPDVTTQFPQTMSVDYVRVYQPTSNSKK